MSDDFSEKVKEQVKKECGYLCCKCKCYTILENGAYIGEVAHIKAASKGGPRFDPSQSQAERTSPSNALLLCRSCHKEIDDEKNLGKYTVKYLENLKQSSIKYYGKISKKKPEIKDSLLQKIATPFIEKNYLTFLNVVKNCINCLDYQIISNYSSKTTDGNSAAWYLYGFLTTKGNECSLEKMDEQIINLNENLTKADNYMSSHRSIVRNTYFAIMRQIKSLLTFYYEQGGGMTNYVQRYAIEVYRNKEILISLIEDITE